MDVCVVEGCARSRYGSKTICEAHYRRLRRTGTVTAERPIGAPAALASCAVDGCERVATERGLCHGHYLRLDRAGDVQPERPLGRRVNVGCTVDGCTAQAYARTLCRAHYRRLMQHGDVRAERPVRGSGRGAISHGYRKISVPPELRWLTNGLTHETEHRVVMASLLSRPLRPDESVHHRNGDRLDNRPDNLELWSRWQPSGQRIGDKVTAAIELLERYAPEFLAAERPGSIQAEN
jgi:hypothetical protein